MVVHTSKGDEDYEMRIKIWDVLRSIPELANNYIIINITGCSSFLCEKEKRKQLQHIL